MLSLSISFLSTYHMVLWYCMYLVVDTIILFLFELNPKIFSDLSLLRRLLHVGTSTFILRKLFRGRCSVADVPSYIHRNEYPKKEFF